ncbi:MAG: hypothetical protein CMI12_05375 [Oceanospirillum sp.]|nr:hypothetical protein [Oceanospirillum sp.]
MAKPTIAELLKASGHTTFTQELVQQAAELLYINVGAGLDQRDWDSILSGDDPMNAASQALIDQYQDPEFLLANANYLVSFQYYTEAQVEHTYRQLAESIGFDYSSKDWAKGTVFEDETLLNDSTVFSEASIYLPGSAAQVPTGPSIGNAPNSSNLTFDSDGDGFDDSIANTSVAIGNRVNGLTEISSFDPSTSKINVPDTFNGYGDDKVHNSQFEAYVGVYNGTTFHVTGVGAGPLLGATHTMILYDNDSSSSANFVDGFVIQGAYAEQQWGISGGEGAKIMSYNPSAASSSMNGLYGSADADTINADAGNDLIDGGAGVDSLTGGADADIFSFSSGDSTAVAGSGTNDSSGQDTIQDFTTGDNDLIQISGELATGFIATTHIVVGTAADGDAGGTDNVADFTTSSYIVDMNASGTLGEGDELVVNVTTDGSTAAFADDAAAQASTVFNVTLADSGATVTLGQNNDTVVAGTGTNSITAGAGADTLIGGGTDTFVIAAAGDTGTATVSNVGGAGTLDDTDTVAGAFDVIIGFQHGTDKLDVKAVNDGSTGAADSVAGLAANAYEIARGIWNASTNTFTVDGTNGSDQVVIFDDGSNDVAVVFLGVTDIDNTDLVFS